MVAVRPALDCSLLIAVEVPHPVLLDLWIDGGRGPRLTVDHPEDARAFDSLPGFVSTRTQMKTLTHLLRLDHDSPANMAARVPLFSTSAEET